MREACRLEDVLGQRSKVSILRILHHETGLTGRAIAKKAGLSPRAAQQALQELQAQGILQRRVAGAAYLFALNRERYLVKHILSPLFENEEGWRDAMMTELRRALPRQGMVSIILFGSMARGESRPGSDLDVMILVEDPMPVAEVAARVRSKSAEFLAIFGMMISPHVLSRREFVARFDRKDKLVRNVVKEGRVVFGKRFEEVLALERAKASH